MSSTSETDSSDGSTGHGSHSSSIDGLHQAISHKKLTFPDKLHLILSNSDFSDIIAWLPHGRSFTILQQRPFEEKVIPLYFRHARYSSFARQVNGWGFRRVTKGPDYCSYYHELFLRGMPHLSRKMKRLTKSDVGKRKSQEDTPPPDFGELSRIDPLPEIENKTLQIPVSSSQTRSRQDSLELPFNANTFDGKYSMARLFNPMFRACTPNSGFGTPPSEDGSQQDALRQLSNPRLSSPTDVMGFGHHPAPPSSSSGIIQAQMQQLQQNASTSSRFNMHAGMLGADTSIRSSNALQSLDASSLAMLIQLSRQRNQMTSSFPCK